VTAWSEGKIGRALARNTFKDCLCALPNCTWTGDEIDLLVVTRTLLVVDVEVKITRADLKADAAKTKWWHTPNNWWRHSQVRPAPEHRDWPRRVWKHYYAMPASIWKPELVAGIGAASGVLLVAETDSGALSVSCARRARPNGERYHLSAADVVAVARLASLRMWDAYAQLERRTP